MKILFSNLGYAKGIGGSLKHHLTLSTRHFYMLPKTQRQVLKQFRDIIERERPDICCMVEIDSGSFHSGYFSQIQALMCSEYCFYDVASKYGEPGWIARLPMHWGKSNAFLASADYPFKRRYLASGSKRLIYEIDLPDFVLFFAHFSLQKKVRTQQFAEIRKMVQEVGKPVVLLADFNIFSGFGELGPLLHEDHLRLLNRPDEPTFRFHRRQLVLDLCLCTPSLAERARLQVIPQPFSDHAALLLEIADITS